MLTSASSSATRISPQHLVDVFVPQAPLAAEALEDPFESVGQCVEHAADQATRSRAVGPNYLFGQKPVTATGF
jgi:hypothetical protein